MCTSHGIVLDCLNAHLRHFLAQPEVAFLFCVKIDEIKDVVCRKDCSSSNSLYFNIYILSNKKTNPGSSKLSLAEYGNQLVNYEFIRIKSL